MFTCLYTKKECKHADKDGECKQGSQNCGWENWKVVDDLENCFVGGYPDENLTGEEQ